MKIKQLHCVQMEEKDHKPAKRKNGVITNHKGELNIISKQIETHALVTQENITIIDLCSRNIETLDNVKLPVNLVELNLSTNKLVEVPSIVLKLEKLKILNLSHNMIEYFDDCPKFCHNLELLDISFNHLKSPPYWIWAETPHKLTQVNLSNNIHITNSFTTSYFEELLQYSTLVIDLDLHNCRLGKYTELLATFSNVKSLYLGTDEYISSSNSLIEIPCQGLDKCGELKRLNVCNTNIYTISSNIEIYKNLVEINLGRNNLCGIPNEFCNLENLETCVLSCNKILYIPDDFCKLQKLVRLYLDSNVLCMLPGNLSELANLKTLDLYNNNLNEAPDNYFGYVEELDLAQNYFEEPDDIWYLEKKEKLRLVHENRYSGRKNVSENTFQDYDESDDEDDEELYDIFFNGKKLEDSTNLAPSISPEDWDSDAYWMPFHQNPVPPSPSPWLCFVKQKIKEGNFCPMDAHPTSITEKVKFEKIYYPQVNHELDGQFDDYSSDDT